MPWVIKWYHPLKAYSYFLCHVSKLPFNENFWAALFRQTNPRGVLDLINYKYLLPLECKFAIVLQISWLPSVRFEVTHNINDIFDSTTGRFANIKFRHKSFRLLIIFVSTCGEFSLWREDKKHTRRDILEKRYDWKYKMFTTFLSTILFNKVLAN